MKRYFYTLLIIIAAMFSGGARSQSLQMFDDQGNVANGIIYHVWGDSAYGAVMTKKMYIKNISTSTITIKARKIQYSLVPGMGCSFCFVQCYDSSVYISPNSRILAPNASDSTGSIDCHCYGHLGASYVEMNFYNIANHADSAAFFLSFDCTPAGITESSLQLTFISYPYPNPAETYTSFNYSFPKNTSAKFVLSDILGSNIKEEILNNVSGTLTINTHNLAEGIYFYSFYEDGKRIMTKKLIVRH